ARSVAVQNLTFALPGGAVAATVKDVGGAADGVSQLVTTSGPAALVATNFANPGNSLSIDAGAAGNATVLLAAMDAGFTPPVLSLAGNTTGDVFRLTSAAFLQGSPGVGLTLTGATFDLNGVSDSVAYLQDAGGASVVQLTGG